MSLFNALGSLIGGAFGFAGAQSAAGGAVKGARINARAARWASRKNLQWQRRFAQKGIQWRVRDARRAGVHPLAALGAQTMSFAPSFSGGEPGAGHIAAAGMEANAYAQLGQDLSRAIGAFDEPADRNDAYVKALQALQLENAGLQNQFLASQIARNTQPGTPPAGPSVSQDRYLMGGQGDSRTGTSGVETTPLKRIASSPDNISDEAGAVTDIGWLRTRNGWAMTRSKDAAERLEDDFIGTTTHAIRNRLGPLVYGNDSYAPFPAPGGKYWSHNVVTGEWILRDRSVGPQRDVNSSLPSGGRLGGW